MRSFIPPWYSLAVRSEDPSTIATPPTFLTNDSTSVSDTASVGRPISLSTPARMEENFARSSWNACLYSCCTLTYDSVDECMSGSEGATGGSLGGVSMKRRRVCSRMWRFFDWTLALPGTSAYASGDVDNGWVVDELRHVVWEL